MTSLQIADSTPEVPQTTTQPVEGFAKSAAIDLELEERSRKGKRYLQILQSGGHLSC